MKYFFAYLGSSVKTTIDSPQAVWVTRFDQTESVICRVTVSRLERAIFRGICGEIVALFQIFVSNFDTIPDLEGHEVESISLCVQTSRRAKKVLVIGMYRPPGLLKATWEYEINNILLRSNQRYESIMLIGDLNCDLSRPDKGAKEGKLNTLMDLMDVYGLTNLI